MYIYVCVGIYIYMYMCVWVSIYIAHWIQSLAICAVILSLSDLFSRNRNLVIKRNTKERRNIVRCFRALKQMFLSSTAEASEASKALKFNKIVCAFDNVSSLLGVPFHYQIMIIDTL